jgi:hypothetical protein
MESIYVFNTTIDASVTEYDATTCVGKLAIFWLQKVRVPVHSVSNHPWFHISTMVVTGLNALSLALVYDGMPDNLRTFVDTSTFVYSILFIIELAVKLIGMGFTRYFSQAQLVIDFVVVVFAILDMLRIVSYGGLSALRSLRLLRVFSFLRNWSSMRALLAATVSSVDDIVNISAVLLLFIFLFGVLGMQLFQGKMSWPGYTARANWDNFGWALITTFQVVTPENWNLVLSDSVRAIGWGAVAYLLPLVLFGHYVVEVLFLVVLMSNFPEPESNEDDEDDDSPSGSRSVSPSVSIQRTAVTSLNAAAAMAKGKVATRKVLRPASMIVIPKTVGKKAGKPGSSSKNVLSISQKGFMASKAKQLVNKFKEVGKDFMADRPSYPTNVDQHALIDSPLKNVLDLRNSVPKRPASENSPRPNAGAALGSSPRIFDENKSPKKFISGDDLDLSRRLSLSLRLKDKKAGNLGVCDDMGLSSDVGAGSSVLKSPRRISSDDMSIPIPADVITSDIRGKGESERREQKPLETSCFRSSSDDMSAGFVMPAKDNYVEGPPEAQRFASAPALVDSAPMREDKGHSKHNRRHTVAEGCDVADTPRDYDPALFASPEVSNFVAFAAFERKHKKIRSCSHTWI